ncbi:hypothetical protein ACFE04_021232 [Oxalis oulophora]
MMYVNLYWNSLSLRHSSGGESNDDSDAVVCRWDQHAISVIGASYTYVPTTLSIILAGRYSSIVDAQEKFKKIMCGIQMPDVLAQVPDLAKRRLSLSKGGILLSKRVFENGGRSSNYELWPYDP